ncbi:hypothetical protein AYO44_10460 [Planctomycetaceae bacterium SCGC AG-212-F19]|nr:hypothetical protein AYO44_10460 [Planctomycetaceae bacterium SCGC AG-212-F19]
MGDAMPGCLMIRKMTPPDLDACAGIESACTTPADAWAVEDFADFLAWQANGGHVALWDRQLVGFVLYRADRVNRRLALARVGVTPSWQRRRVGTRLVRHIRDWLRAVPDVTLVALVHERHVAFQCFLRAAGFRAMRVCKGCYDAGANDGYWFEAPVDAPTPARSPLARGETEIR